MNIKKVVIGLLAINLLQFIVGVIIWIAVGRSTTVRVNGYIYFVVGLMLFSSLITVLGLYFATRYRSVNLEESIRDLEELNTKLRAQRHDYLNHFQVIYGLMELGEYSEAKKYLDPVFKDIMKVSKALKTAQPAINALLQAKMEVAERNQINLYLEIRSDLKNIPLEAWNLCKVIANIIDNSMTVLSDMDRTDGSSIELEQEKNIHIEIAEDSRNYTFLISNNGPMIPEHLREEIFRQGVSTKKEQGHGMGLYIANKIVKETGGTIDVVSNSLKTSFYVSIPKR